MSHRNMTLGPSGNLAEVPMTLRALVVGFDGSASSRRALVRTLNDWKRSGQPRLVICYVNSPRDVNPFVYGVPEAIIAWIRFDVPERIRNIEAELHGLMSTFCGSWEFLVREGDPARVLEMIALQNRADTIVVGRGLGSRLLWQSPSISFRLERRGVIPTAIVP